METVKELQNRTIKNALIAGTIVLLIGLIIGFNGRLSLSLGLILGISISILNFIILADTMSRAVTLDPSRAKTFAVKRYFLRYIINGIAILIAIFVPFIGIVATVIGLSLIKFVILFTNLFDDKQFYKNIFKRREV